MINSKVHKLFDVIRQSKTHKKLVRLLTVAEPDERFYHFSA
jgi:hypothetical protein